MTTTKREAEALAQSVAATLPRARRLYHDPALPPRECDRCGRVYTGPAVYCSLACALEGNSGLYDTLEAGWRPIDANYH